MHRELNKGCPQSSVFGPKFWNLLFVNCIKVLNNRCDSKAIAYIDNLVVLISGNSWCFLKAVETIVMQQLDEWSTCVKLQLLETKLG